MDLVLKWHIGYCQPFVVETAAVQQLGVRSLDAVDSLSVDQRPGVFIRVIDCWVSSEFSGVNALCSGPSDFVSEVDFFSMLSGLI